MAFPFEALAGYESSESDSENNLISPIEKRCRLPNRNWALDRTYESAEAARSAVASEKSWLIRQSYDTADGRKVDYRCHHVRKAGQQCPAGVVLYHCESANVSVFRTEQEHDHSSGGTGIFDKSLYLHTHSMIVFE